MFNRALLLFFSSMVMYDGSLLASSSSRFPGYSGAPKDHYESQARKVFEKYMNESAEYLNTLLEMVVKQANETIADSIEKQRSVDGGKYLAIVQKTMTKKDYIGVLPEEVAAIIEQGKKENRKYYEKFGINLPQAILFTGPPGTGKTLLAKIIAGEWGFPFYEVKDLSSSLHDGVSEKLNAVFDHAKNIARESNEKTVVLFVDEIDTVAKKRGNDQYTSYHNGAVSVLLTNLDGISHKTSIGAQVKAEEEDVRIILIGATNDKEILDDAFLSRINVVINIPLPDASKRKTLLEFYLKGKGVPVSNKIDFEAFAHSLHGMSARDIYTLSMEARRLAAYRKADEVTVEHLKEAILKKADQLGL